MTSENRIEKQVLLRAPRPRVWRAITDHEEFGSWFGVRLAGPFVAGQQNRGQITSEGYENLGFDIWIDAIEPETRFAYRWHPYAVDPAFDYSAEPTTLVEFRLEDAPGGTLLTLTESGFEGVPASRRAEAFRNNGEGWAIQVERIAAYLDAHA